MKLSKRVTITRTNELKLDMQASLLRPKTMIGAVVEYTLNDKYLSIVDMHQTDPGRRKIEIPVQLLGRFISELAEIERIIHIKDNG